MLTKEPTIEMVQEWKRIYSENRDRLKPNRKSGTEINDYFCLKYAFEEFKSLKFCKVVKLNITENETNREKLPHGTVPQIVVYKSKDASVLVGIDLITGFFHIEGEDITRVAEIYDDLFAFRGLDEKDMENYFLVAQYIQCLDKRL
ncbi:MAG: hypothetical protein J1G02_00455 [Clostridiales bacterium]|nr:hypothetical protein [Clostridiales bacterium]